MDSSYAHVAEESLLRFASALGSKAVLLHGFQYIPSLLANYDWRLRHAGLVAIAQAVRGRPSFSSNMRHHRMGQLKNNEFGTLVE